MHIESRSNPGHVAETARTLRRFRAVVLLALCTLAAGSCNLFLTDPRLPDDAERFNPPVVYQRWWTMVESCSGKNADLSAVTWYHVPAARVDANNDQAVAYWSRASNRIVLIDYVKYDGAVVRHEMLHAIRGSGGHPRSEFIEKCGGVVSCEEGCLPDPPVVDNASATWARVPPDQIDVNIELSPASPNMSIDGGFFQVIISARNANTFPVVVDIAGVGTPDAPGAFSAAVVGRFGGPGQTERARDNSVVTFKAGEVKHQIFDFSIAGTPQQTALPAGLYTVNGSYASHVATPVSIRIN